jgi:hypothetical protein
MADLPTVRNFVGIDLRIAAEKDACFNPRQHPRCT